MKIAVFSDIHGNIDAARAVLDDIEKHSVDNIICLGDLTGYGPFQNEVVEFINSKNVVTIIGNYDKAVVTEDINYIKDNELNRNFALPWAIKEVTDKNKKILKRLPDSVTIVDNGKVIVFVHGSNRKINEYLLEDSKEAKEAMDEFGEDILVCGHTHIPYTKKYGDKILINVGSVGKPKGGSSTSYAILSIEDNNVDVDIIKVEYHNSNIIKTMKDKNFPESLIKNYI